MSILRAIELSKKSKLTFDEAVEYIALQALQVGEPYYSLSQAVHYFVIANDAKMPKGNRKALKDAAMDKIISDTVPAKYRENKALMQIMKTQKNRLR